MEEIDNFLAQRSRQGLLRVLRPIAGRSAGKISLAGREYTDFSSNDYLGLSQHPKLIAAGKNALEEFGSAVCASRLLSGDLELHHRLEEKIAGFKNKEAAIFFNSGYQANTGIISSLCGRQDAIFCDRLAHASIIDGAALSRARLFRFRHNDAGHLEELLKTERHKFKSALMITESIFSMEGDRAPLKELARLKGKYDCRILVDEAHATGIFGRQGSGLVEAEGLTPEIDLIMGTFSKALAGFGAYLAASQKTVDYLVNCCRSFIYSTALPASIAAINLASIDLVREEPRRRLRLLENAEYFRAGLQKSGLQIKGSSQIVPVVIGDNFRSAEFSRRLQQKGYWVLPVRPPAVPAGEARLRFSLSIYHGKALLGKLIEDIRNIVV